MIDLMEKCWWKGYKFILFIYFQNMLKDVPF